MVHGGSFVVMMKNHNYGFFVGQWKIKVSWTFGTSGILFV
jgi:hypothetical protein